MDMGRWPVTGQVKWFRVNWFSDGKYDKLPSCWEAQNWRHHPGRGSGTPLYLSATILREVGCVFPGAPASIEWLLLLLIWWGRPFFGLSRDSPGLKGAKVLCLQKLLFILFVALPTAEIIISLLFSSETCCQVVPLRGLDNLTTDGSYYAGSEMISGAFKNILSYKNILILLCIKNNIWTIWASLLTLGVEYCDRVFLTMGQKQRWHVSCGSTQRDNIAQSMVFESFLAEKYTQQWSTMPRGEEKERELGR